MQVLPRLQPREFNDLIVSISLIRPGPVQGDMVHPYLRRRFGEEAVTYPHPLVEPALRETLGVMLFQEQVLKVARDLAGFTPGQGELLRRALGAKRAIEAIERCTTGFIVARSSTGRRVRGRRAGLRQLRAFGGYSFPKVPRRRLRRAGLPLGLAQTLSPAGILCGTAQQPADGLLVREHHRQRCQAARDSGAAGRSVSQRRALHRRGRRHSHRLQLRQGLRRGSHRAAAGGARAAARSPTSPTCAGGRCCRSGWSRT